ncbi:MAG: CBS domain-containing protein [Gammaproteobacteria bacterium]|nr:CBS domain-containing protein [Gammaproteobacteria bacterium]NIT63171.1 CBS domain-containing protein [Gammaproteobacteria bacterium]NIV20121.1 CBS domain-containing protein [Gammaproteobacteria bacterium]NIX11421.1 CBS domain-containing protein [Gammaproteobacteria bacterium]NIY31751.1 CBS domain-containing protein [Gammaproteobacteria bacterium]
MDQPIDIERLSGGELFSGMAPETVSAVVGRAELREWAEGETIFRAGEPYRSALFIIYDGEAELQRPDGRTGRYGAGAVLGLSNYLDEAPYRSTARALSACKVLIVPDAALHQLEAEHPALSNALNHLIAERIRSRSVAGQAISGALARPVRAAMKSPLATCDPDVSLRQAYATMLERRIGSLGVRDRSGELLGILTCAGISRALALEGASAKDAVRGAACDEPHTIAPHAPLWQADEMLQRYGVKYLIVMEGERPLGVISQSDILRALISHQPNLLERAGRAGDLAALRVLHDSIHEVAREARETNRLASRAVRIVSDAHLAIQRRCVELTLEELRAQGHGEAPRPYAVLIMGSGGRREMLLSPDQDNGIILADRPPPLSQCEEQWFERFAKRLNASLDRVGYILCPGDIMARNPMFRKTLAEWRRQITYMAEHPNQKAARWSNIVFDFDTLYGDESLTHDLREHVLDVLGRRQLLLEFMVEDDAEGRPPLGLFNRLVTGDAGERKGKIDIKRNGLRIIADAARVYTLSAGIASTNTVERLQNLVRQGVLSGGLADSVLAAYEELLDLLLGHQVDQAARGEAPDKLISPDRLSDQDETALRAAMRAVKRLQDQLQGQFGRSAF